MTTTQAYQIEQLQRKTGISDAQLMDLSRKAAQNSALVCMAHLTREQSAELIIELKRIEFGDEIREIRELVGV